MTMFLYRRAQSEEVWHMPNVPFIGYGSQVITQFSKWSNWWADKFFRTIFIIYSAYMFFFVFLL